MKTISSIFNESIDLIKTNDMFVVGSSYEDRTIYEIEREFKKMEFILDAACPGKFILIVTGEYIERPGNLHKKKDEYYDNYNNRYIIIREDIWETFAKEVMMNEKRIYDEYNVEFPKHKQELYDKFVV